MNQPFIPHSRSRCATNQVGVDSWLDGQGPACPCQQSATLSNHPIHGAIEVHNREGCRRRPNGNEGCDGACRGDLDFGEQLHCGFTPSFKQDVSYLLIKERHAQRRPAEGFEDAQRRNHLSQSKFSAMPNRIVPIPNEYIHYPPCHSTPPMFPGVCTSSATPKAIPRGVNMERRRHRSAHLSTETVS